MNKKLLITLVIALCLVTALTVVSCNQWDTPYEGLDKAGSTVSVKYLANGGVFAGTKDVTVVNVYSLENAKEEWNGMKSITLVTPDNKEVLGRNAFTVSRTNCILEGWYVTTVNEDGSLSVSTQKWDFSKPYTLDPSKEYDSETPVLILSARWVPYNTFNVYVQNADGTFPSEPTLTKNTLTLEYPEWNVSTGKQDLNDYPAVSGKTFDKAYADAALTEEITSDMTGSAHYDEESDEFVSDVVNVYATYKDGVWYEIYNARQLANNADANAFYNIRANLDFSGITWPAKFVNGEFNGAIYGNGFTVSNVKGSQMSTTNYNHGLFGTIGERAVIENLTLSNASFTIVGINSTVPSYYGLFAGNVKSGADIDNVTIAESKLLLSCATKSLVDIYDSASPNPVYTNMKNGVFTINKVVGSGTHGIDMSGIVVEFEKPQSTMVQGLTINVDSNGSVSLSYPA